MVWARYITSLLLATVVLADYYIDNANTSVVYAMPATGQSWQTYSVSTQQLVLEFTNSTGNYSITLDASNCYDQNYALGVCGTGGGCSVQIPFTGSGIAMYVFNAGASGMTASFSVDGSAPVSNSIAAPTAAEHYQVSNVSLYNIQGLSTGSHTIQMTLLNWNGDGTSMKFDYAYVNETFVAASTPTNSSTSTSAQASTQRSQTPSPTSTAAPSASNKVDVGAVVGGTLGGVALLVCLVIAFCYFRKRRAEPRGDSSPGAALQVDPFRPPYLSNNNQYPHPYTNNHDPVFQQSSDAASTVPPFMRSAILRDAHANSDSRYSSEQMQSPLSTGSAPTSGVLQPLRRQPSFSVENDPQSPSSASHSLDTGSPFSNAALSSRHHLTQEQVEVINRLRAENVPAETVGRVIEEFVSSQLATTEVSGGTVNRATSVFSSVPPSYRTRGR